MGEEVVMGDIVDFVVVVGCVVVVVVEESTTIVVERRRKSGKGRLKVSYKHTVQGQATIT